MGVTYSRGQEPVFHRLAKGRRARCGALVTAVLRPGVPPNEFDCPDCRHHEFASARDEVAQSICRGLGVPMRAVKGYTHNRAVMPLATGGRVHGPFTLGGFRA